MVPDERREPARPPLRDLARRIRRREVSALEVAERALARIAGLEGQLHAWATVDPEQVRRGARQLDREIVRAPRGPLHGVPIGVKDLFGTKHLPTAMGSPLFAGHLPASDAAAVARLRAAGAVILGKTVTTQFGTLDPGPTRNPWNPDHTPGGSSSGSAAAVASGMCPAATGTQTAGSLGRPAAYCGIVGILPTQSRISLDGVFPVAWSLDHAGVLARSLDDASIVLGAMCGEPMPLTDAAARPKLGIVRGFFRQETDPGAWARHQEFIAELLEAGIDLVDLSLPPVFDAALPALRTIMRAELAAVHEHLYPPNPDAYAPAIRGLVESGLLLDATDYLRARRIRRIYQREMRQLFASCDVILSPGATGAAPAGLASTGKPLLQAPWTLADFPTVSLPLTLGSEGLPLGIQLTGPPLGEPALLEAARWVERFIGFDARPPLGTGND